MAPGTRVKSRRWLTLLVAVPVSLFVGYFVVSKLSFSDLAKLRASAKLPFLALGFAAYFSANVLRARRFRALTGDQIATFSFLRTVVIQNILNTFLPLRAGEASYLYLVHRSRAVKPGANIGSLLGARVLDLFAALVIPLATLPLSRAFTARGLPVAWLWGLTLSAGAALALSIWRAQWLANRVAQWATGSTRPWLQRALGLFSDVLQALGQLGSARLLWRVALLTGACWTMIYVAGYFTLLGVGVDLDFWDSVFAYSFPVIASMTPFYMLGGFGVYEGSVGLGLHFLGVPLSAALAAGLALHVTELLFVLLPAPITLFSSGTPRTAPDPAQSI